MLVLTVIQGPDKGRTFELPDNEPQLIGRSSEALPITDTTVSRRHAELTPDEGQWWLRDLSSQNGTFVNGVRIEQRTRLVAGDQIRVGATLLVYGTTRDADPGLIRLLKPDQLDATVERVIPSSEDSVMLAEAPVATAEARSAAVEHLRVLYRLTQLLSSRVMDRKQLLTAVLDLVFEQFRPERGFVVPVGPDDNPAPEVVKYRSPPRGSDEARFNVSRSILQHALSRGEGVLSQNAMSDQRFAGHDSVQRLNIRSAMCSPIKLRDRTFGAIYIDSSLAAAAFTPGQLALLNAIGLHTGMALANMELVASQVRGQRLAAAGETVATLSHSIKNILQGLRGGADVVELGLKKDDLQIAKGGWNILKRNIDRIMALTLNMLTYSRQRTIEPEVTRLGALIEDCAQLLQGSCEARQVALLVDVDPELPPVLLDPNLMHQALMNLMTNAVEAVEAKRGVVTVRVLYHPVPAAAPPGARLDSFPGPTVQVSIMDNGPGVPSDKRGWIFEPFNSTKGARGTGLGLAVAKRIVEEHQGVLRLDPASGRGAAFSIVLPVDRPAGFDPSQTDANKPHAGDGPRVFH